jgi:hypothetical protein
MFLHKVLGEKVVVHLLFECLCERDCVLLHHVNRLCFVDH